MHYIADAQVQIRPCECHSDNYYIAGKVLTRAWEWTVVRMNTPNAFLVRIWFTTDLKTTCLRFTFVGQSIWHIKIQDAAYLLLELLQLTTLNTVPCIVASDKCFRAPFLLQVYLVSTESCKLAVSIENGGRRWRWGGPFDWHWNRSSLEYFECYE